MFKRFFFLPVCFFVPLFGAQIIITSPGIYTLGTDIAFDPGVTTPERVIQISTSNVTLDLGGVSLSQVGVTAGFRGIEVDSGLSNIIIRNGVINTVSDAGILVNSNCSNILIEDMQFIGCGSEAIEFAGAAAPNEVKDCMISNCRILRSGLSANFIGILLSQTLRTEIDTVFVNNNGNTASNFVGVRLSNAADCNLTNVQVNTNVANPIGSITCFDLVIATRCIFDSCIGRNNSAGAITGFNLSGASSTFNLFKDCIVERNVAANLPMLSFNLDTNSQNNIFLDCLSSGNSGIINVVGFRVAGGIANNFQNNFISCIVLNNSTVGGVSNCAGFSVDGSNFGIIKNCIASSNTAGTAIGVGLDFVTGTGGNNWTIIDNQMVRNTGGSAANSFGIRVLAGANNLFSRNIGFNNNTTPANQLSGVASVTTPAATATNNMNTVTSPWTNVAVAS